MLSDILLNIGLANELKVSLGDSQFDEFIKLLSAYSSGMWLYPGVIKRKLHLNTERTYELLRLLEKESLIESYYELCCGNCQRSSGNIYRTINELPNYFQCDLCDNELPAMENAMLIYKVISG